MSDAWEAQRATEEQRHSEEAASAVLKSQNDSKAHQCMESIESLSVNHQNDGEESSEVRSSVAAVRSTLGSRGREAVRVAVQTQKADAELGLRGQRRGTHLGFGTEGERTGVDPGGCGSC